MKRNLLIFLAFAMALIAMSGSLFLSEVLLYPPCVLCWYQRVCMYPLVIIFLAAFTSEDRHVLRYSLPLSGLGWLIAVYHNLLYYEILPESASPCLQGVSCTDVQLELFGFMTIPLMSLTAFTIILALQFIFHRKSHEQ